MTNKLVKFKPPHYLTILAFISTGLNLICGLTGIVSANEGNLELAFRLLILGSFCDVLDGRFARRAPTKSELGVYADSFADLFTFALLPSYIVLNTKFKPLNIILFADISVSFILAIIYSFMGWLRLVRFSIRPTGVMFEGLPSSAAAIFLSGSVLFAVEFENIEALQWIVILILLFVAFLMISKVPFPSPKRMWRTDNVLFAIASAIGVFYIIYPNLISLVIILIIFILYIFLGPIYYLKTKNILP